MTRTFFIHTLGCKVNQAESEKLATALICAGWQAIACAKDASLIIVNTCTVTGQADKKNRKTIRKLLKESMHAPILVTGCAINIDSDFYAELDERVVCESNKELLVKRAEELIDEDSCDTCQKNAEHEGATGKSAGHEAAANDVVAHDISTSDDAVSDNATPSNTASDICPTDKNDRSNKIAAMRDAHILRTRANLKIQDGCNNACTFCIVHTARGPAKSMPSSECLAQVQELVNAKTAELVLVGIDLGAWRESSVHEANKAGEHPAQSSEHLNGEHPKGTATAISAATERDLAWLVNKILKETSIGRIRLSSLEPQNFSDALIDAFAKHEGRLCRHAHLCLQSGSDKVLHEMARHYTSAEFLERVKGVRQKVPQIALSSDVIVGFPGESDDDFEQTCSLVQACQFMRLHVFRYSARPMTPAALRDDQIEPEIIAMRAKHLENLANTLSLADKNRRIGCEEFILAESEHAGTSESYHTSVFTKKVSPGKLIYASFIDIDEKNGALIAEPLD